MSDISISSTSNFSNNLSQLVVYNDIMKFIKSDYNGSYSTSELKTVEQIQNKISFNCAEYEDASVNNSRLITGNLLYRRLLITLLANTQYFMVNNGDSMMSNLRTINSISYEIYNPIDSINWAEGSQTGWVNVFNGTSVYESGTITLHNGNSQYEFGLVDDYLWGSAINNVNNGIGVNLTIDFTTTDSAPSQIPCGIFVHNTDPLVLREYYYQYKVNSSYSNIKRITSIRKDSTIQGGYTMTPHFSIGSLNSTMTNTVTLKLFFVLNYNKKGCKILIIL